MTPPPREWYDLDRPCSEIENYGNLFDFFDEHTQEEREEDEGEEKEEERFFSWTSATANDW